MSARLIAILSVAATVAWAATPARAQGPLDLLRGNSRSTLDRLPDDQIEGTVWEYTATVSKDSADDEPEAMKGRFCTEGEAVFDLRRRLPIPTRGEVEETIESIRAGELDEISLPEGAQQKRIGEYRYAKGKLLITFNDPKSLHGTMNLRKKKKTDTVWIGQYLEKEKKRVVQKWSVEVRPIED